MHLINTRFKFFPDSCIGRMEDDSGFQLFTMEPPDRKEKPNCIPAGFTYDLIPYHSPAHGSTWCLHNPDAAVFAGEAAGHPVPQHLAAAEVWTYVEIHAGNFPKDTLACFLVGEHWNETDAIWTSRVAMEQLLKHLGPMTTGHKLTVTSRTD